MVKPSTAFPILPSGSASADNADPTASSGVTNGNDPGNSPAFFEASPFATVFTQAVTQQNAPPNALLARLLTHLTTPAPAQTTTADTGVPLPTDTPAEVHSASTIQTDGATPTNPTAGDAALNPKSKIDGPKANPLSADALAPATTAQ